MDKNLNLIFEIFDSIQRTKKSTIKNLFEAPPYSADLLGGSSVKIPKDGAHAGQSGWQSSNAWDIPSPIDTPVYALTSGRLKTFHDYGPKVIKKNGKKLFGIGFTVESDGGLPNIYYAHLKNTLVKKGDHVECGQLLGYIMDFPGSSYDHVHIGVEPGSNIRELISSDGKIGCSKPKNSNKSNDVSKNSSKDDSSDSFLSQLMTLFSDVS